MSAAPRRAAAFADLPFAAVSFAYFGYAGLFGTYAPLWFQRLGYTTFAIGAITSMQSATRLVAPYAWGWVADHGRRERLLRLAVAGALLASLGYFFVRGYAAVTAVTLALFVCTAGVIPISEACLAHRVSVAGRLDVARYGRVRMWGSVGFVAAVAASGFALQALGVGAFPAFTSAWLGLLLLAAFRLPEAGESAPAAAAQNKGALAVLREPVVAWFFGGVFLTVLAHTSLYAFYSLYLASLGYGKGAIGLLWALGVLVELAWFFFQGRWTHRLSMHAWLLAAALVSVLRFVAIAAFGAWAAALVVAQCLHAVTFAAQHSACIAVISRHFPGALRGRGQALYAVLGYGASGVIGGVAGGALSERLGFSAVFWAAASAALAAALCCRRAMLLDAGAR